MSSGLVLASSGVFVAVALMVGVTLSWWLSRASPERRRLARVADAGAAGWSSKTGRWRKASIRRWNGCPDCCQEARKTCRACNDDLRAPDFIQSQRVTFTFRGAETSAAAGLWRCSRADDQPRRNRLAARRVRRHRRAIASRLLCGSQTNAAGKRSIQNGLPDALGLA